ncbi:unnamed protein product [Rhizophagus irregularis]|nr:unnamed protein product [Rhizophagus irregularis]
MRIILPHLVMGFPWNLQEFIGICANFTLYADFDALYLEIEGFLDLERENSENFLFFGSATGLNFGYLDQTVIFVGLNFNFDFILI